MSRIDFLNEKASNFRAYILEHSRAPETESFLNQYQNDSISSLVATHLLPLYALGQLDVAVTQVVTACKNDAPEFRAKILRYFTCFVECLAE